MATVILAAGELRLGAVGIAILAVTGESIGAQNFSGWIASALGRP
jgi:hypothetical protein